MKLAHEIAPLLSDCTWAIGGSTLLHHHGIEPAPSDLDIVVVERDFDECTKQLMDLFVQIENVEHSRYASKRFARFRGNNLPQVDLMAGISVRDSDGLKEWVFNPAHITHAGGLPWMSLTDWICLYKLFNRPKRVAQIQQFLSGKGDSLA